jgi:hypothetical protein
LFCPALSFEEPDRRGEIEVVCLQGDIIVFAIEGHSSVVVAAIFGNIMALKAIMRMWMHQKCLCNDDFQIDDQRKG